MNSFIYSEISLIIFVGGKAVRMGDACKKIPKSLLEVKGKPILSLLINFYKSRGISNIFLSTKSMHKSFEGWILENDRSIKTVQSDESWTFSREIENLIKEIDSKYLLFINGDTLVDYELDNLLREVSDGERGSSYILLTQLEDNVQNHNAFKVNNDNLVISCSEVGFRLDSLDLKDVHWEGSSTGICLIERNRFESKKLLDREDIFKTLMEAVLAHSKLYAVNNGASRLFLDCGTPERLEIANQLSELRLSF